MKSLKFFIFLTIASNALFLRGVAAEPARSLNIIPLTKSEEIVSPNAEGRCNVEHIPDSPARAFRSSGKKVFLFATHYTNQPFTGSSLDNLKPACSFGFQAAMDPDSEKYNARTWLQTFYTEDGRTVYSIGSSDYHGSWFNKCTSPSKENPKCWWSALTLAISKDGGKTFNSSTPPNHIIARAPFSYSMDTKQPMGFFTSSNIVKRDNFYYTLVYTSGYKGQNKGSCLMRTNDLSSPTSWRSWNGKNFSGKFLSSENPESMRPEDYFCSPVTKLEDPVRSLLWHEPSGQYIAVFSSSRRTKKTKGTSVNVKFQFSTSRDLIEWSTPRDIIDFDSPSNCIHGIIPVAYPSIIDHSSKDMNFGTVGDSAYLYFTRFNFSKECTMTMDRDLVKIPISILTE